MCVVLTWLLATQIVGMLYIGWTRKFETFYNRCVLYIIEIATIAKTLCTGDILMNSLSVFDT